jgi:hypothetical protein
MAVITQIELANYLGEGYKVDGRRTLEEWNPLYRAVTLPLRGNSAAIQIENGDGKSSISEGCIYLLSHDRRLKDKVFARCAPSDSGWSHIRIEFGIKELGENILQQDMITETPEEFPGATYVVGLCTNRDTKDANFYIYNGTLKDAPVYKQTENGLILTDNEAFKKSVERIGGSKWNKWSRKADWEEDIKQFVDTEVIRQNVEFQVTGAGDASAMLHNIKPEAGESFDAAFFRHLIAPELLKNPMGNESDKDEHHFEDTLVKSLQGVSTAMVEIAAKETEYKHASEALTKFEPVIEQAERVIRADAEYKNELATIVDDAAIIHAIVVADPVPGIPHISKNPSWAGDKRIVEALSHMVIAKREGVLITDEGLSSLTGIAVGEINKRSKESVATDSQLIDLAQHLKIFSVSTQGLTPSINDAQHIDYKEHLKKDGRGGRRYAKTCYRLNESLDLLKAISALSGARTSGLDDILTKAFGIAMNEIDTNSYRRERNRLFNGLIKAKADLQSAKDNETASKTEIENLERQVVEAEANQIAYSDFVRRKSEFPEHLHQSPLAALEWSKTALKEAQEALSAHKTKVGQLTAGYGSWTALTSHHGKVSLVTALSELNEQHSRLTTEKGDASKTLRDAHSQEKKLREDYITEDKKLQTLKAKHTKLGEQKNQLPIFHQIFGDVDPDTLNPQAALNDANGRKSKLVAQKTDADNLQKQFASLKPGVDLFVSIFGEADVAVLNPLTDLEKLQEQIATEESIVNEHQPFVDALSWFGDKYSGKTPAQWLTDTAKHRQDLNAEQIENTGKITNLNGELDDLEKFAVADDRVYSQALKVLSDAGIRYERLYDIIMSSVNGDRRKSLLSLFSSALSAPVVATINDAEATTATLEKERATVPVFLKDQLVKFAKVGEFESSADLAFTFLVGRRTRQVDILLDKNLINEEKYRISKEIQNLETRNQTIAGQLEKISEDSQEVRSVLMAKDAITKSSVDKHAEASATLDKLQEQLPPLKKRASPDALSAIDSMKQFIAIGGKGMFTQLIETDMPALKSAMGSVSAEIITLEQQTTDEANKARAAAKEFKALGGEAEFNKTANEVAQLEPQVKLLLERLGAMPSKLENLERLATFTGSQLATFEQTYYTTARDIEAAIKFEADGNAAFMQTAEETGLDADNEVDKATNRLSGIDFEKAERYIEKAKSGDKGMTERIANAKAAKAKAVADAVATEIVIQHLDVDIANITPLVEELHVTAVAARDQYAKIATLDDDVRQKYLVANTVSHEVSQYADMVRVACLGDKPGTSVENEAAIYNLNESIKALKIDTQQLLRLNVSRKNASQAFNEKRNEFCDKARSKEIKGLSPLEIEEIASAKTIHELNHVKELKGRIELQINAKNADLQKSRELAEKSKNASIDNMSNFARQAETNLKIMDRVMQKTPSGRFYIDVQIADHERVLRVVESLLEEIQDRERSFRERSSVMLNEDITKRREVYRDLVKRALYKNLFINPSVEFSHTGIWAGARKPMNDEMSKGQITALHLMWMIKQAEYSLQLVASRYQSKRERDAALKNSQRILFFDGLFSNLSNDNIIDDAFQGLKFVGDNFQLIGLLHHPRYVNNSDIFPIHLVGKRFRSKGDQNHRGFMAVQPWQKGGEMAMFASFYKRKLDDDHV